MYRTRLIALPCKIFAGVVPDERAFEITLDKGETYSGVAPVHYFWNSSNESLNLDEPSASDEIVGKVAGRLLEQKHGVSLVSIPDGAVILVKDDLVSCRPGEVIFHVPIGPRA